MTSRRVFIQTGVAVSAALSASGAARAATGGRRQVPLHAVVFDTRFAASAAFGRAVRALGARTTPIRGDVTKLWDEDLGPRWREAPATIAGLTSNRSFYTLEVLARDHGMRVVFHADHRPIGEGAFEHRVVGPHTLTKDDVLDGSAWPSQLARLVTRWPSAALRPLGTTGDLMIPSGAGEPLVSFVIAPIARV